MKRQCLLVLGILILGGCRGRDTDVETEISVPVSVQEIKKKPIEEFLIATGTAFSVKETLLKSEMPGYYHLLENPKTRRFFALGDQVAEGQEIIHLKDEEFENNIKLESQKLNLDISEREYEKQQSLYEKGGVTLRELKNAEVAYVNAQYAYDNALIQLAKMKIDAPFNGVIVDLPYYTQATRVASNASMVTIMNYSQIFMEVNLPAKELGNVKVNQPVRVMNYSLPDDTLIGQITQVSPAIDATTRTFKAALIIDNPDLLLRPGMFVKSEIVIAREDSALVIPKDVILAKQRGKTVFIVQSGAAQERVISTGLENPDEVQVVSGIRENERLVIRGYETLRHRSKVKIIR